MVGAGVVALVTGTVLPDMPDPNSLSLVDADAAAERAAAVNAADRASRSDTREVDASAEQVAPDLFVLPLHSYTITSKFGPRPNPGDTSRGENHPGVDLGAPCGTQYHAIARGKVVLARSNGGYGLNIMIDHGGGVISVYGHSSALKVKEGQIVEAGQLIGLVGSTGYSFGCHLHLEIRVDGKQTDPLPWLKARGADVAAKTDPLTESQQP
jgi:murein DD-endopeptidase MepM/ murein hydrolase activator NlpD